MAEKKARIGIIGGSGIYDPDLFENVEKVRLRTPYGSPSAPLEVGDYKGVKVAFMPRHGHGHTIPPHMLNFRANIWAMKELGVERIISPCAVGSLQENLKPKDFVVVDQFIDFTKNRHYTFFDGGRTYHVSMADPFCETLRKVVINEGKSIGVPIHEKGTYICIEGPRFSTRAESKMFRNHADVIGMTAVPEASLAREAEICYVSIAMITDYDVWAEKPVNTQEILETLSTNMENIKKLLTAAIPKIPEKRDCECKEALKFAAV
jgi:5'-methylthioadenosine phosphorylase